MGGDGNVSFTLYNWYWCVVFTQVCVICLVLYSCSVMCSAGYVRTRRKTTFDFSITGISGHYKFPSLPINFKQICKLYRNRNTFAKTLDCTTCLV